MTLFSFRQSLALMLLILVGCRAGDGIAPTNQEPTAHLGFPNTPSGTIRLAGGVATVAVSLRGSFDRDGQLAQAQVDWGDGTPDTVLALTSAAALETPLTHHYTAPGDYIIRATLLDSGDPPLVDSATLALIVFSEHPPEICVTPSTLEGQVPLTVSLDLTCTTDPDTDLDALGTVTIDWGDGTVLTNVPYATAKVSTHTYTTGGAYVLTASVTDDVETVTTQLNVDARALIPPIVCVETVPPMVDGVVQAFPEKAVTFNFSCSGDPDGELCREGVLSIDWGDGGHLDNAEIASLTSNCTNPLVLHRAYVGPGTYGVAYTLTDGNGLQASGSLRVKPYGPNSPPRACLVTTPPMLAGELYIEVGSTVDFDFECSFDPDGNLCLEGFVGMDFGDGVSIPDTTPITSLTSQCETPILLRKTYAAVGDYSVAYRMTDSRGGTDDGTVLVHVLPFFQPPVACVVTTPPLVEGEVTIERATHLYLDFSCSTDVEGALCPEGFFGIDLGNGLVIENTRRIFDLTASCSRPLAFPAFYDTVGDFLVQYTLTDSSGMSDSGEFLVHVVEP